MEHFDNFKWLLFQKPISEERLPDESVLVESDGRGYNFGVEEYYIVVNFHAQYIRPFGKGFILKKANELENSFAKAWATFAIARAPFVIKHDNEEFEDRMEELGRKSGIPYAHIRKVFLPYMHLLHHLFLKPRNHTENGALPFRSQIPLNDSPLTENGAYPFTFQLSLRILYVELNLTYDIQSWQERLKK